MAIQCTHCGTTLKDDARFCNICGTLVPSHPFSPKSGVSSPSSAGQPDSTIIRGGIREQIAQQPPAHPVRRIAQDEAPSWMNQLASQPRPRTPSDGLKNDQQNIFPPVAKVDTLPKQRDFNTSAGSQLDMFEHDEKTQIVSPARELRVKVWEQNQNQSAGQHGQQSRTQSTQTGQQQINDNGVEDLPTRPLMLETPVKVKPQSTAGTSMPPSLPTTSPKTQKKALDDVDQLDTVPLATLATPMGVKPNTASRPATDSVQLQRQPGQQSSSFNDHTEVRQQSPISQPPYQRATGSSAQDPRTSLPGAPIPATATPNTGKMSPSAAPIQQSKQRSRRRPLVIILGILLLLIVGGSVGAWMILEQPFTVAGVTQPQQTFANTRIGVSLSYPTGWTAKVDTKNSTILLSDSSQTAEFKIISAPANGADVGKYLQQEASQQSMTGLKPIATQSFAGTSWQQLQGSVLLNGASYTEILFATIHGQTIFTIMQLAPQSTYSQEEQYAFSSMRSSFRFTP